MIGGKILALLFSAEFGFCVGLMYGEGRMTTALMVWATISLAAAAYTVFHLRQEGARHAA